MLGWCVARWCFGWSMYLLAVGVGVLVGWCVGDCVYVLMICWRVLTLSSQISLPAVWRFAVSDWSFRKSARCRQVSKAEVLWILWWNNCWLKLQEYSRVCLQTIRRFCFCFSCPISTTYELWLWNRTKYLLLIIQKRLQHHLHLNVSNKNVAKCAKYLNLILIVYRLQSGRNCSSS